MVRVAGLGSSGLEFEPLLVVELTRGGVDSAYHPSEVGEMSTSVLVIGALCWRHSCAFTNDASSSHRLHMKEILLLLLIILL